MDIRYFTILLLFSLVNLTACSNAVPQVSTGNINGNNSHLPTTTSYSFSSSSGTASGSDGATTLEAHYNIHFIQGYSNTGSAMTSHPSTAEVLRHAH